MVLHVDSVFGVDGEHLGDNILVYSASDDAYWACWSNVRRGPRNADGVLRPSAAGEALRPSAAVMVCGEQ